MPIELTSLLYYPIKACRGFEVESALVERMGLTHDRRMMVVTPQGKFLTQREHHKLALVTPTLNEGIVTLSAPGFDSLQVAVQSSGISQPVDIWASKGVEAIDQGDEAASWFSDWLGALVRLVHIADGYKRKVKSGYAVNEDDHTGFADGFPILITAEESLDDLNTRLETPLPMNRFRPNIVVRGCDAYAEDTWNQIAIGDVNLSIVKPCARCVVTTIDKDSLETDREPLRTLATYRRRANGVIFGQNAIPVNGGRLRLGMTVEILS